MSERERIVRHVVRCRFCRALLAHSHRRRDRALLAAADLLAWEHAENDAEREAFAKQPIRTALATPAVRQDSDGQDQRSDAAELRFSARCVRTPR